MDDPYVDDLLERMEALGALRARKMFGGAGIYCDDVFFALVAGGVLYFKVGEESQAEYERAGMARFRPFEGRGGASLGYYEVPLEVQERSARLIAWARKALSAARERDEAKRKPKGGSRSERHRSADAGATPVRKLENLGVAASRWLESVGIQTRADLERAGSVRAFEKVRAAGFAPSLRFLWALEGALLDRRWNRLPKTVREDLRRRADLSAR